MTFQQGLLCVTRIAWFLGLFGPDNLPGKLRRGLPKKRTEDSPQSVLVHTCTPFGGRLHLSSELYVCFNEEGA